MTSGRWVSYGMDAAEALRAEISRVKADEPLAPVTVVVASNQIGVSTRRLLASGRAGTVCGAGPGLIGVTFVTPYRLAELLGAAPLAEANRRPVSVPVLSAAVRRALAEDPGAFGPVATHAATEAALVAAYRELRDLDPTALDALAATSQRAGEVVRIHRATRARLEDAWYDEEDLMAAAAATLQAGHPPPDLGAVIVHLPQRLSHHAANLLRTLGSATELVVLAGTTGVPKADVEVVRSVARLGVDLGPPPTGTPLPVSPTTTRIVTASDADDEVRAAVRTVVDAVRAGTPLDRIAVLYAAPEPYRRLLAHHLDAAGVTTNGTATVPLSGRVAGRTLLGLLALPATGYRRQDLFAWLSGAPILVDGRWAPTTAWERASRDAGVVAGRQDWDRRLTHLAQRDPRHAEPLRSFVLGLADRLAGADAPATWHERVRWTKALLTDLLGSATRRADWPDAERRAAERLDLALDRLTVLDDLEGPIGLDVFTRTLTVELEGDLGRTGRFGEGVLVAPVTMGVGVDLDLVVFVGMAEGTFPSTLSDDSLLPDEDRDRAGGSLPLRSGHVDRLHHQFLAALAGAQQHVLCVPKGDLRRSRERVPSRWALDVASTLAGETWWSEQLLGGTAPWLTHHASFDDAIRTATTPATPQEHRLRTLLALDAPRPQLHQVATAVDPVLAAGVETIDARTSSRVTRFDGNLAGIAIPSPVDQGASATSLESWAKCPHGYFVHNVLRVRPIEQPEDVLQITPLDRGTLVHQVLEDFIAEAIATGRVPDAWTDADHDRLQALADACCDQYEAEGLTGRPIFWERDRGKIIRDLHRFLHEDAIARRATGAAPIATELPFGSDGIDPLAFPLDDGRTVPLRGKADRVDRTPDGTLHVLDYKTGSTRSYTGISAEDPHQGGQRLQLAVYGLAARQHTGHPDAPVRAEYWFTSTKGGWKKLGYDIDDDVLAQVATAMTTIVHGIERGLFLPHPRPQDTSPFVDCHACDPDGLGTAEQRRQFLRKLDDPTLADYVALVAPDLEEDGA
jgi:RecB family exonuclease